MVASRPDDRQYRAPGPRLPSKPKRPAWRLAAAIVLTAIGIISIFAICFPTQFKQQLEVSVFRQPTPYTQLFFGDPTGLPSKLEVGHVNKFTFTVINDQGRSATYHYTVTIATVTGAKLQKTAGEGSFTLGDSQSITQTVGVVPTAPGEQYLVKVTLIGTPDFIQFYGDTPK